MEKRIGAVIRERLAGGLVAFGLVLLILQALSIYYRYSGGGWEGLSEYTEDFNALFLGAHAAGGALGGYLVGRRVGGKAIQAGVVTAVVAYMFEWVYYLLFEGYFAGNLWALLCLVGGGASGAYFAAVQTYRKRLRSRGEQRD
ncbi:MAG: hypothetical protein ACE5OO_03685 [Candidatus Bathyarchaeia archaeon]